MGVDVYLRWEGMKQEDKDKQITGFDVTSGKIGYLRGSYNGHIGFKAISQLFFGLNWDSNINVNENLDLIKNNLSRMEKGIFKKSKKEFYSENNKQLEIQSYYDFVKFAQELVDKGNKVWVYISY